MDFVCKRTSHENCGRKREERTVSPLQQLKTQSRDRDTRADRGAAQRWHKEEEEKNVYVGERGSKVEAFIQFDCQVISHNRKVICRPLSKLLQETGRIQVLGEFSFPP